jgi:hypothetical protein
MQIRILLMTVLHFFVVLVAVAQQREGVWKGIVSVYSPQIDIHRTSPQGILDVETAFRTRDQIFNGLQRLRINNMVIDTDAKIEWVEVGDQALAQLTSYGPDNKQITMYQFSVRETPKEFYKYHLQGKSVLVNEAKRKADLFDLRGSFMETDSSILFYGIWEHPFSRRRFGYFEFVLTKDAVTMNPELIHALLKQNKNEDKAHTIMPIISPQVHDSLVTDAITVIGNLVDNGLIDQDTLSIWFNGKLLEDNVVPGKKPFFFRANLSEKEWNHLTIRCKNEGRERGMGVHLNMGFNTVQMKYNLVLYQNGQADWVIRRKVE